jgi:hypothetical protein
MTCNGAPLNKNSAMKKATRHAALDVWGSQLHLLTAYNKWESRDLLNNMWRSLGGYTTGSINRDKEVANLIKCCNRLWMNYINHLETMSNIMREKLIL